MPSFGDFVGTQFLLKIPKPTASFASKTVIITGANGGLGKETAKHIVRLGASTVILGCRNLSKGNAAKREIETETASELDSSSVIQVWELDIESPKSVKQFVDRANALPRLDVLINNAGIQSQKFSIVYGTERTLAVNVIGTFLLALQLLPKLRETAHNYQTTPHMTFVGSAMYDVAKWPGQHDEDIFAWYEDKAHFSAINQYSLSKLLQLYAAIQLSAIIDPANITTADNPNPNPNPIVINSLDPCFCKTGLPGELPAAMRVALRVFELTARTAEEGARLVVQTASAGRETHGLYMRAAKVREYDPIVLDAEKASYVWELLCKKLEGLQPGIL